MLPVAPTGLTKVESESSIDSTFIEWSRITGDDVPVTGYHLYMDDGYNGDFE
jgi:hypothetical protein